MDEKIKKIMMSLFFQGAIAAGIFLVLLLIKALSPQIFEKCSVVWTRSTDLKKAGELLVEFLKEIVPF